MEKKKDAEDIREWFMRLPVVVHIFLAAIALWLLSLMVLKSLDVYTRHNESIVVPNVKGKTPEEAHREIRKTGLRYIVLDSIYSKDMAPGAIVEVVPAIGSKVKKDRILYLTINARTAQMAIVPDVTDLSLRQAFALLQSHGFTSIDVVYVSGSYRDLALGVQLRGKTLRAGDRAPIAAKIVLRVSDGGEGGTDSTFWSPRSESEWRASRSSDDSDDEEERGTDDDE